MDTDFRLQSSDFRRNASLGLAIIALIILTPFSINNFTHDRIALGLGSLAIVALLGFNGWSISRGKYTSWPTLVALVPAIVFFLTLSIRRQGMIGVLWCYPATLSFYIMLPERRAWAANLLLLVVVVPLCWFHFDRELVIRIAATLIAVSAFSAIFIRAIAEQQLKLEVMATTDALTGLLNRVVLNGVLDQAIRQGGRSGAPMSLLALDIDHFKSINDTFGHDAGDEALRKVGQLLSHRLRGSDSVFRLGGEEFLALLFDTGFGDAQRVAEELRHTFEAQPFIKDRTLTVSIGVATLAKEETADQWMKRVDERLYSAKQNGRNRVAA